MKKNPLLLALVLATALAAGSCASSKNQSESAPSQSAAPSTAPATCRDDTDSVIGQQLRDYEYEDVTIDRKLCYTDSSGTDWVRLDAYSTRQICQAGPQSGPSGPVTGITKKAPDADWELVSLGIGGVQCGVPADVQTGLGFAICPASEGELNEAIEDFLLNGPAQSREATDIKISRKAYYTDSSGTDWAEFCLLPIPNVTSSTYGIMKKVPGGDWEGVNFGSAAVECGLPADVQSGLGFPYCPPQAQ